MKKIFLALFILLLVFAFLFSGCQEKTIGDAKSNISNPQIKEAPANNTIPPMVSNSCSIDSDCVPSSCCHAKSCVLKSEGPDCKGAICTLNCEPGTLDCGGSCQCNGGKCNANLSYN